MMNSTGLSHRRLVRRALACLCLLAAVSSSGAQQRSTVLTANGLSLGYLERGAGTPVILVHGSIGDYREWSAQIGPLSQRYRVIAYSRRYHWPNTPPGQDADAGLERQVEDLAGFIATLKLAPAHLVGHSYGGATVLLLVRRHPELVRTMVLAEPPMGGVLGELPKDHPLAEEGRAVRAAMREAFASGDAQRIARTYAARVAPGQWEQASTESREMLLSNVAAFRLDFLTSRPGFTCDDAKAIAVPGLVISGGRSALGLQRIAHTLAGCLHAAELVEIPEATHWMQSDHAAAFNEAVRGFLDRH
jgi:pimeloyl-ACP methyl ester carboxylesterase